MPPRPMVAGVVCAPAVDPVLGFRIEEEHEVSGIDLVVHAETAYGRHATAGARSSGSNVPTATSRPFAAPGPRD